LHSQFNSANFFGPGYAFLYRHGQFVNLIPASPQSSANGINNQGQIVGALSVPGTIDAFLYRDGQLRDLGTLGGVGSSADGINDRGQVVGESSIAGNSVYHAFIYSAGQMQDLGAFGPNSANNSSVAVGINQHGQVIGYGYLQGSSGVFHAFLYTGGLLQDLGTLGGDYSYASGINNRSQVVGASWIAGNSAFHGFIYSGGQMQDLNKLLVPNSGWIVTEAAGINEAGQIACSGHIPGATEYSGNFYLHALLLTPVN
jgi:probable HAF family extracellular repeat protein